MRKGRIASTFILAAILILRGGDCVPLLFANQQTKDCCTKGECSRSHKSDPCCQTSSSDLVKHFEAQEKVSLPTLAWIDAMSVPAVPAVPAALSTALVAEPAPIDTSPTLLPAPRSRASLPLLI